jgi:aminopeptidase N
VFRARARIESELSRALEPTLLARYGALDGGGADTSLAAQSRRRLRNACLAALCRMDSRHHTLARVQFGNARNLTDRLAALGVLVSVGADDADAALDAFAARYADDAMVLDKWLSVQAVHAEPGTLARVQALTSHRAFNWSTPNAVYGLLLAFAMRNPRAFHRIDGASYRFMADAIARVDAINPQVAARLVAAFGPWRSYEPVRRALMRHELERLEARRDNSPDLADLLGRALGA